MALLRTLQVATVTAGCVNTLAPRTSLGWVEHGSTQKQRTRKPVRERPGAIGLKTAVVPRASYQRCVTCAEIWTL